jgi:hypothetical protein
VSREVGLALFGVWSWRQERAAELGAAVGAIEVGLSATKLRSELDVTDLASSVAGSESSRTAGVIEASIALVDDGVSEVQLEGELDVAVPTSWVMER